MTEREFEQAVVDMPRLLRWKVAHFRPARTERGWRTPVAYDGAGWPDLVLVHLGGGWLLARELKTARGKLSAAQEDWLAALEAVGVDAGVWRPEDWTSGRVERELRGAAA